MTAGARPVLGLVAFLGLSAALAGILLMALLLVGADPHTVFLPGHLLKSWLHAPNAVGVVATFLVWWALVAIAWLAVRRATASR